MKIEAETLRITASARLPDGQPYTWSISFEVPRIMKSRDPAFVLFNNVHKLLRDFPNLVETYLEAKEKETA